MLVDVNALGSQIIISASKTLILRIAEESPGFATLLGTHADHCTVIRY